MPDPPGANAAELSCRCEVEQLRQRVGSAERVSVEQADADQRRHDDSACSRSRSALSGSDDEVPVRVADMIRAVGVAAILCLLMVLPYLPGGFDGSAAAFSLMAQVAAYLSVLLVPVGAAWIVAPQRSRLWRRLALAVGVLIAVAIALAGAAARHQTLGVVAGIVAIVMLRSNYRRSRSDLERGSSRGAIVLYLVCLPVILLVFRMTVVTRAAEWSRARAIAHSAPLITEIEAYRQRHGRYPISLQSLNRDVPTGVVGIERFEYEPNEGAYNLYFVRPHIELDAWEVVMFNPLDEHRFTSHELDILQYDGEHLDRRRGDRRRTQLPQPHWISILFD